jgi:hypothetical protein
MAKRDWESWLNNNLKFPFEVERTEDEEGFGGKKSKSLFGIGHKMNALALVEEDNKYDIITKAEDGRKTGYVPLCDVEVTSRDNINYWPVKEYFPLLV